MTTPMPDVEPGQILARPGLSWGIKQSFTRYVDSMPDGKRGAGYGATEAEPGIYFFELEDVSDYDAAAGKGIIKYRGDVRFAGHHGMLFVMIVDPWIDFRESTVVLTVLDAERWPKRDRRIELATLSLGESATAQLPAHWTHMDARLTQDGSAVFNDVYRVGEILEPVRYCAVE